jgi:hypothetical protein
MTGRDEGVGDPGSHQAGTDDCNISVPGYR